MYVCMLLRTTDYCITVIDRSIVVLSPSSYTGKKGPAECISFDSSRPCEVFIVPRDPSQPVQVVPVDPHFNFHYANGYEDELTGQLHVDCSLSNLQYYVWIG